MGYLNGSFPTRGSGDGQRIGAALVCCITLVLTILRHQRLAWHIVGDFQSAFLLYVMLLGFYISPSRRADLSEVHPRQESMGACVCSASIWISSLHWRTRGGNLVSVTDFRTDLSSHQCSRVPATHSGNHEYPRELSEVYFLYHSPSMT